MVWALGNAVFTMYNFLPHYSYKGCGKLLHGLRMIMCSKHESALWLIALKENLRCGPLDQNKILLGPIAHKKILCCGP
jgi:hypothetical protein